LDLFDHRAVVEPEAVLGSTAYQRIRPHIVEFPPYTPTQARKILKRRTRDRDDSYTDNALAYLSNQTQNIAFAIRWLYAAQLRDTPVTPDILKKTRRDGILMYHDHLIRGFGLHHNLVLEAVHRATAEEEPVETRRLYEQYQDVCRSVNEDPRTKRRVKDFIDDLELLHIIDTERVDGGFYGRAREIKLHQF
jgi:Cdc6-like AAA superfamily ATPase